MRNRPIYLTALSAVLLASCGLFGSNEEEEAEQEVPSGYFTALLNGEPWRGPAIGGINEEDYFAIGAGTYDSLSYWNGSLTFSAPFDGEGTYPLYRYGELDRYSSGLYGGRYYESDGDAGIAEYNPTSSEANRMTITRYDSARGIVEGTFAVTLVVDPGDREPEPLPPGVPPPMERRHPDTLRFTEGRFYVEIFDDRFPEQP